MSANFFTCNLWIKLYISRFVEVFEPYIKRSRASMNSHFLTIASLV